MRRAYQALFLAFFLGCCNAYAVSSGEVDLGTIVVTATKIGMSDREVPGRIDVIGEKEINGMPVSKVDEALEYIPGVNGRRNNSIYSVRPVVSLRGLGGDEQGRTLVLMDGIPMNKADTGDVNWNMMSIEDIEQIEIFKGPGSSLYGNNAMGGVINIITKKPEKLFEQRFYGRYGSNHTWQTGFMYGGRSKKEDEDLVFLRVSGKYDHSIGYVSEPGSSVTSYTVKRYVYEGGINVKAGYDLDEDNGVSFNYIYDKGKRGEGEKYLAEDGVHRLFETNFFSLNYNGRAGNVRWNSKAFYDREKYLRVSERMRGMNYERFDVVSTRDDYGFLTDVHYDGCDWNTISGGVEVRVGTVDAADVYRTSPDIVENRGSMLFYSAYLRNETRLLEDKLILAAGVRYDRAKFYDGYYNSTDAAWAAYNGELSSGEWGHISPRAAARYFLWDDTSVYCSYSSGFRASILDDLCRSGWMWVGPKIANPDLEPEKLDNYEVGANIALFGKIEIKPAFYYSVGKDFLYYIDSGRRLWGTRTVYKRENVGEVRAYGTEIEAKADLCEYFSASAGYSYQKSVIKKFEQRKDLEGKTLTYVPRNQVYVGTEVRTSYINGTLYYRYKDAQFTDEENNGKIAPYSTLDMKLWKKIDERITLSLMVQNILNRKYMESADDMNPGRMIMGEVSVEF